MNTTNTTTVTKTPGKPTGLIFFALVVIAAVLIVVTAIGDATGGKANAGTAQASATQAARCGMDADTFTKVSPALQVGLPAQCNSPAELQP